MSDDQMPQFGAPKIVGRSMRAPGGFFEKIRAKKAEVNARVLAGKLTREDGSKEIREFQSLSIAHVREHSLDPE